MSRAPQVGDQVRYHPALPQPVFRNAKITAIGGGTVDIEVEHENGGYAEQGVAPWNPLKPMTRGWAWPEDANADLISEDAARKGIGK